ncbi:uncharacterized protein LOC130733692 isoform X3 [Lotus japonicus]|uniref:uncharacterized protein LOC130733692 isoform X3 n=1 Tax=Lotus japonicus TaxID=34305 RepID=UPI00258D0AB4|nr:uncharacterized protein LOC130733692 isoform X3 [Lotus japonicus]
MAVMQTNEDKGFFGGFESSREGGLLCSLNGDGGCWLGAHTRFGFSCKFSDLVHLCWDYGVPVCALVSFFYVVLECVCRLLLSG